MGLQLDLKMDQHFECCLENLKESSWGNLKDFQREKQIDGIAVGLEDGLALGLLLGELEGNSEGEIDGIAVGLEDGLDLG